MQESLGYAITWRHGLVINILKGLKLVDQIRFANMKKRTYEISVPWNIDVKFTEKFVSVFPNINDVSDDFICTVTKLTIEDEEGEFMGPVSKLTGQPSGEGVFVSERWIHMGKISDGKRFIGERLVIKRWLEVEEFRIFNANLARDGTFLEKVQLFNSPEHYYDWSGNIVGSRKIKDGFYINKEWKSELVSRLNFSPNDPKKTWLALSRVRFGGRGNHRFWQQIEGFKPYRERENEETEFNGK
jgi:hypothetical protein